MQDNVILGVEIGTPVANFDRAFEFDDLENRLVVMVMNGDTFLVFFCENTGGARWDITEGTVCYSCA